MSEIPDRPEEGGDGQPVQFSFRDPRQAKIHRQLSLLGPGPAAFYRDACLLIEQEGLLRSASHVLAHLFREIESSLRDVVGAMVPKPERSKKQHKAEIESILCGLGIPVTDPIAEAWLRLAGEKDPLPLHARAHRRNLDAPRRVDQDERKYWCDFEAILEVILDRFETRYLSTLETLDKLLALDSPQDEDVSTLAIRCPNNFMTLGYFFKNLDNPKWLPKLRKHGFFTHPPEEEPDPVRGNIRVPPWPQGEFLTKMASVAPEEVAAILAEIPVVRNDLVHGAIAEAVCNLPTELAADLVPRLIEWCGIGFSIWYHEDYTSIIVRLAESGQIEASLLLARAILAVSAPETENDRQEPVALMDKWHYEKTLSKLVPVLATHAGPEGLKLFCDLLQDAVDLMEQVDQDGTVHEASYRWPAAVEDHDQNKIHDYPKDHLVYAVRDTSSALLDAHEKATLETVESRPGLIFKRIGLYLRSTYVLVDLPGTEEIVQSRQTYEQLPLHHELYHLLRSVFGELSHEAKAAYFDYVQTGFNPETFKRNRESWGESAPSEDEVEEASRHFEFRRLVPIREHLTGEWKEKFEVLNKRFDIGDHPDFLSYIGTARFVPVESPKPPSELASMAIESLVTYLREYEPSDEPLDNTLEGLRAALAGLVRREPEKYLVAAAQFHGVQPAIMRGLLSGARDRVKSEEHFAGELWEPLLTLCEWIVARPRDEQIRKGRYTDLDPGWRWTRKAIAELIEDGLRSKSNGIPEQMAELTWQVLSPLTDDPEPTSDRENEETNPTDLAINTVRGQAMHAVVQYGLWLRRIAESEIAGETESSASAELPLNVREVLDRHLDVNLDSSLAIRAVYGEFFPWLLLLNSR